MLQATPQSPLHNAALAALSEAAVAAPVELLAAMLGSKQTLKHMMQVRLAAPIKSSWLEPEEAGTATTASTCMHI
jgi:hypothetical protein